MAQRVAVDLIADVGAEMNAFSLDMMQNIAEWRGGEISLKQIRWMAKTEAALRKRVA